MPHTQQKLHIKMHDVWLCRWQEHIQRVLAGGAVSKSKLTRVTPSVTLTVMHSAATKKRTQPAPRTNDSSGMMFCMLHKRPADFPLLFKTRNCRAVRLLLVLLFPHFLFLPPACTLFTLQLTKKKKECAQIVVTARRPHSERDECKTH